MRVSVNKDSKVILQNLALIKLTLLIKKHSLNQGLKIS